jgi:hypothetical protein
MCGSRIANKQVNTELGGSANNPFTLLIVAKISVEIVQPAVRESSELGR